MGELYRKALLVTGLTVGSIGSLACVNNGRGEAITACDGAGTELAASFPDSKDHARSRDPSVLANYGAAFWFYDGAKLSDPESSANDAVDKVGEIACLSEEGVVVLTEEGALLSEHCARTEGKIGINGLDYDC